MGSVYHMDTLDKDTIHIADRREEGGAGFYHATQKGTLFKVYEL